MPDDNSKIAYMAEQMAKGLEETRKLVENIQTTVHTAAIEQTSIKADLKSVSKDLTNLQNTVDSLDRIIRDSNGDRSFIARLLVLENHQKATEKWIEEQAKTKKDLDNEDRRGKWQLKAALFTGSMGFIAAIVSAIIAFFK